jgi:hypothetical protein
MLSRINTSQIIALQLAVGVIASVLLAVVIHFPDEARRPMPPPGKLLLSLIVVITVGIIALGGTGVRSTEARTGIVIASTIIVWLIAAYALIFVWINTYGT